LNAIQIKRYREECAEVMNKIDLSHCITLNLKTSHQTIELAEGVSRSYYWHLTREAFTKKAIKNGRQLSYVAVIEGRKGLNLHLHLAVGHFNKNHSDEQIWAHCKKAALKTEGVWNRSLTNKERSLRGITETFVCKPMNDKRGWIEYILSEKNIDRTYDQPTFDTRDADRILVQQIRTGN
jgi:hypothetical protein